MYIAFGRTLILKPATTLAAVISRQSAKPSTVSINLELQVAKILHAHNPSKLPAMPSR